MDENLKIWNWFADIDPQFTKPITGKPYKGTSPNPHYVIKCLTEMFGPVGVGFGWEVTAEGFQPLGDEVLHWCRIRFWHGEGQGFDAYGQTKALMMKRNGELMSDEDAPKKSLTDAITKAAAQVGVASNIFLGRWDDNGYVQQVNDEYRKAERPEPTSKEKADWVKQQIAKARTTEALDNWMRGKTEFLTKLDPDHQDEIQSYYHEKTVSLQPVPVSADLDDEIPY